MNAKLRLSLTLAEALSRGEIDENLHSKVSNPSRVLLAQDTVNKRARLAARYNELRETRITPIGHSMTMVLVCMCVFVNMIVIGIGIVQYSQERQG